MKLWDWIKYAFSRTKTYYVRLGFDVFFNKYFDVVVEELLKLSAVHSNKDLDLWWDEARAAVVEKIGKDFHDNWYANLINWAWEHIKATQPGVARTKIN